MNLCCKGSAFSEYMQENGDFFTIFSLEDARVASYRLRASQNATSVFGDPAEVRGKNICQTTGKSKTGGGERYQQHKQHKPTTYCAQNNLLRARRIYLRTEPQGYTGSGE